ncbi:hypothetical protein M9Y10_024421 [Tritrichomonas musculus]|uniref:Ubiquitin-like domain-containing protein n=1 Tax=Tritrichomonas musculus TaxID=1915356 RepID=A0ABR2HD22_9EUKA
MESILVAATNANFKNRYFRLKIKKGSTILELKQHIINSCYAKKAISNIKDLIFIKNLDNAPPKTHQIDGFSVFVKEDFEDNDNLFSKEHENEDAYTVFKENNITAFYYLALFAS